MKLSLLVILCSFGFSQCTSSNEKVLNPDYLNFENAEIQTGQLKGSARLEGRPQTNELHLDLDLKNTSGEPIELKAVKIETKDGIQSKLLGTEHFPIIIEAKKKISHTFIFKPVNNLKIYEISGDPGLFNEKYNVVIEYADGKVSTKNSSNQLKALDVSFETYKKKFNETARCYMFNEDSILVYKQKDYLEKILHKPSFVHLSEQEIAVAGLNFRMQAFQKNDTLHASLFIVNHAEFAVKVQPDFFDIISTEAPMVQQNKNVEFKKISGSFEEKYILRKGDRAIISMSKHFTDSSKNRLSISFKNIFFMPNGKPLFYDNPELVKL